MRKTSGMVAVILLAMGVTDAQEKSGAKPTATGTIETTLIANERALQEAVAKGDRAAFQSLVLPEGVWTSKSGFIPMNLLLDGLDSFNVTKWDIVNPRVTLLGEGSAIVRSAWTGTGTFQNQPLASTTLASTVWTERNGKWLAAHHQETDLMK